MPEIIFQSYPGFFANAIVESCPEIEASTIITVQEWALQEGSKWGKIKNPRTTSGGFYLPNLYLKVDCYSQDIR
jgi:hypothetical protein